MKDENENGMLLSLSDRAQKIAEALYRVTDLLSDKEPLKWQLRIDAVELFDFLILREQKEIFDAKNIFGLVKRLVRTLQLACASSAFVSSINFEVLRREYLSLSDLLENQVESEKNKLQSESFILPEYNGQFLSDKVLSLSKDKSIINGQSYVLNNHNGHPPAGGPKEKELINKADNGQENTNGQKGLGSEIVLKERKRKILSLIKNGDWLNIREISDSLPEFGDKSIQRDLLEMVSAGVLKKIGDKRWRKYALV